MAAENRQRGIELEGETKKPSIAGRLREADGDDPLPLRAARRLRASESKPAAANRVAATDYLIFASLYATCLRTTGSYFFTSILSG